MKFRRATARPVFSGLGDDAIPFTDPGADLSPVSVALPDNTTNIPGLDEPPTSTVPTATVTITAAAPSDASLGVLGWLVALAGVYYLLRAKPRGTVR